MSGGATAAEDDDNDGFRVDELEEADADDSSLEVEAELLGPPSVWPVPEKLVLALLELVVASPSPRELGGGSVAAKSAASQGGSPPIFVPLTGTTAKIE